MMIQMYPLSKIDAKAAKLQSKLSESALSKALEIFAEMDENEELVRDLLAKDPTGFISWRDEVVEYYTKMQEHRSSIKETLSTTLTGIKSGSAPETDLFKVVEQHVASEYSKNKVKKKFEEKLDEIKNLISLVHVLKKIGVKVAYHYSDYSAITFDTRLEYVHALILKGMNPEKSREETDTVRRFSAYAGNRIKNKNEGFVVVHYDSFNKAFPGEIEKTTVYRYQQSVLMNSDFKPPIFPDKAGTPVLADVPKAVGQSTAGSYVTLTWEPAVSDMPILNYIIKCNWSIQEKKPVTPKETEKTEDEKKKNDTETDAIPGMDKQASQPPSTPTTSPSPDDNKKENDTNPKPGDTPELPKGISLLQLPDMTQMNNSTDMMSNNNSTDMMSNNNNNNTNTNNTALNNTSLNGTSTNSTATNGMLTNGTATNSTSTNSTSTNSTLTNSTATNSTSTNSTATNSTSTNSTATNSTSTNSTANNSTEFRLIWAPRFKLDYRRNNRNEKVRISNLTPGLMYTFQVRGVNKEGEGPWSDPSESIRAGIAQASPVPAVIAINKMTPSFVNFNITLSLSVDVDYVTIGKKPCAISKLEHYSLLCQAEIEKKSGEMEVKVMNIDGDVAGQGAVMFVDSSAWAKAWGIVARTADAPTMEIERVQMFSGKNCEESTLLKHITAMKFDSGRYPSSASTEAVFKLAQSPLKTDNKTDKKIFRAQRSAYDSFEIGLQWPKDGYVKCVTIKQHGDNIPKEDFQLVAYWNDRASAPAICPAAGTTREGEAGPKPVTILAETNENLCWTWTELPQRRFQPVINYKTDGKPVKTYPNQSLADILLTDKDAKAFHLRQDIFGYDSIEDFEKLEYDDARKGLESYILTAKSEESKIQVGTCTKDNYGFARVEQTFWVKPQGTIMARPSYWRGKCWDFFPGYILGYDPAGDGGDRDIVAAKTYCLNLGDGCAGVVCLGEVDDPANFTKLCRAVVGLELRRQSPWASRLTYSYRKSNCEKCVMDSSFSKIGGIPEGGIISVEIDVPDYISFEAVGEHRNNVIGFDLRKQKVLLLSILDEDEKNRKYSAFKRTSPLKKLKITDTFSLEAAWQPGLWLVYFEGEIKLKKKEESDEFMTAATWIFNSKNSPAKNIAEGGVLSLYLSQDEYMSHNEDEKNKNSLSMIKNHLVKNENNSTWRVRAAVDWSGSHLERKSFWKSMKNRVDMHGMCYGTLDDASIKGQSTNTCANDKFRLLPPGWSFSRGKFSKAGAEALFGFGNYGTSCLIYGHPTDADPNQLTNSEIWRRDQIWKSYPTKDSPLDKCPEHEIGFDKKLGWKNRKCDARILIQTECTGAKTAFKIDLSELSGESQMSAHLMTAHSKNGELPLRSGLRLSLIGRDSPGAPQTLDDFTPIVTKPGERLHFQLRRLYDGWSVETYSGKRSNSETTIGSGRCVLEGGIIFENHRWSADAEDPAACCQICEKYRDKGCSAFSFLHETSTCRFYAVENLRNSYKINENVTSGYSSGFFVWRDILSKPSTVNPGMISSVEVTGGGSSSEKNPFKTKICVKSMEMPVSISDSEKADQAIININGDELMPRWRALQSKLIFDKESYHFKNAYGMCLGVDNGLRVTHDIVTTQCTEDPEQRWILGRARPKNLVCNVDNFRVVVPTNTTESDGIIKMTVDVPGDFTEFVTGSSPGEYIKIQENVETREECQKLCSEMSRCRAVEYNRHEDPPVKAKSCKLYGRTYDGNYDLNDTSDTFVSNKIPNKITKNKVKIPSIAINKF
eukprot:GHVL01019330.1.p1 GENE.GHVL01019330.1~~GHVL01019330.1.p1  ORF type:complete len:1759 (+),score=414.20 GHVL01019330.1:944-6220(+)